MAARLLAPLAALIAVLVSACDVLSAPSGTPHFSHVLVVVLENKEVDQVVGNPEAPVFAGLARRYATLADYHGVAHPSLPNYLALVSGSTQGITNDCTDCHVDAPSLADTLSAAHKTWKTYAEGLPHPGYSGADAGRYAKRHDPFSYFEDVARSPARMRHLVPLAQLGRDLGAGALPDFSLVVPDLCHDMHDCSVATGDRWLGSFLAPLLRSRALARSVIFVVFDEGESTQGGGGHLPAIAVGPAVKPGSVARASLDHYSLLRTIEDAWGLPALGRSKGASPIRGIWR
jgi:phosphatidylinositol-3-phosphatase